MTTRGDTFVDTANTDLTFHTATGANGGWTWTNPDGTGAATEINASNQLKLVGSQNALHLAATVGSNDQFAQVGVMAASDSFHVLIRGSGNSGTGSFYGARYKAGNWELWKCVTGAFTNLGTSAATLVAGDTVKLQAVGSTITVSINGSSLFSVTDTDITTGTGGLQSRSVDGPIDPWIQNYLADVASVVVATPQTGWMMQDHYERRAEEIHSY